MVSSGTSGKGNQARPFTPGRIRAIVRSLDIYDDIQAGDTHNMCLDYSERVLHELLERGANAIMVQLRDEEGTPHHHYVLCQVGDGISSGVVVVDPTIGQFYHKYKDVFVGTMDEMRDRFIKGGKSQKIFDEYWPEKINVCEPEHVYSELPNVKRPSEVDPREFQETWGDMGVVQKERFTSTLRPNNRGNMVGNDDSPPTTGRSTRF